MSQKERQVCVCTCLRRDYLHDVSVSESFPQRLSQWFMYRVWPAGIRWKKRGAQKMVHCIKVCVSW